MLCIHRIIAYELLLSQIMNISVIIIIIITWEALLQCYDQVWGLQHIFIMHAVK